MNPMISAYTRDMHENPDWTPSPKLRHTMMLAAVEAARAQVKFTEMPRNVRWSQCFVDDEQKTVAVRTDFADGAGAVQFHFDARAELTKISGRGVEPWTRPEAAPISAPEVDPHSSASPSLER